MNIESLVDRLVPNLAHAQTSADELRKKHPNLSAVELAEKAIHSAKIRAATAGAATGIASSPFTMVPAVLADMAAVLGIEAAMVAEIGAILNPGSLTDATAIKADVISVIFPAAASQALRQLGIRAGERLSQAAIRKYATEDMVRSITRFAARYLGKHLTRDTIMTKAVPIIGMGIGAGWNWLEVKAIGARAIRYYSDEPIGPAPSSPPLPGPANQVWQKVRRFMPGRKE